MGLTLMLDHRACRVLLLGRTGRSAWVAALAAAGSSTDALLELRSADVAAAEDVRSALCSCMQVSV
jgi:hypothetical protein